MDLSIVIPCYNEAKNLPLICARLAEITRDRPNIEVILVDNGSVDGSDAVFRQEFERLAPEQFKLLRVEKNQGYGHGILQGLAQARGNVLAWTHSDMQTDPADVICAYDLFRSCRYPVLVKGKRHNRALLDSLFTFGMQCIVYVMISSRLDDINAQPKVFSREFYDSFIKGLAPLDFSLDLFLLHQAVSNGHKIETVAVDFAKRIHGEAKGGGSWKTRIRLIQRTLAYIVSMRNKLRGA
jgi:glycosyltransferase involved in cell wall biosynthesis